MTLVLLLALVVVATPPTIDRLFQDELSVDEHCRNLMPASADDYEVETRPGSFTCTFRRNGKVTSIVNGG